MKVLNAVEIEVVNGGSLAGDVGYAIGYVAGVVVNALECDGCVDPVDYYNSLPPGQQ